MKPTDESPDLHPLASTFAFESSHGTGEVIGPYHLIQMIGQGGMGEVWLAEQKEPMRRSVAVKLIKAGMDTREVVARFEAERQALALMDHPAIAKVFDAGSTSQGRPYFVLEYVAGTPITTWCDKHKLTTRERLELFIHVCEGVQHAHQKAIIHRDLKPSNILVSESDGRPVPKIIDFGVAKAISQRLTAETLVTRIGTVIGTLEYMSPEQADSAGEDIDTRTDVYSLGVVLYELLVGALPLEFGQLTFAELLRKLREEEAMHPSTKAETSGEKSVTASHNRRTDPPTLARELRGDLDAITLKALEKERSRRYATPLELAGDIDRYLRNEPVIARPSSAPYRARKYIRRHRIGVAITAMTVLLLIFAAVAQTFQLRQTTRERDRANQERDRANRERDRAKLVTDFMEKMFKVSDPSEARGNTVTAREILDKASKEVDTGLSRDPELQAQMMDVMGTVYLSLGLYSRAHLLLESARDIRRRVLGPAHRDTLRSTTALVNTLLQEKRFAEGVKLQQETLDTARRILGSQHQDTLRMAASMALLLEEAACYAEAEKLQRETLDIQRRVLGPDHPDTLDSMRTLAIILRNQNRVAEAVQYRRDILQIQKRALARGPPPRNT